MSDRSRQRLRTIITILATALLVAPAAALATHSFTDADDGDFYHAAVGWMKDNGVTVGCNPPDNTRYCPDEPVTRGEMAVFLERLDSKNVFLRPGEGSGGDGGDAETLDGIDSAAFATDAEVDAFMPIAVITIVNGTGDGPGAAPYVANFRAPITAAPTYENSDTGRYVIDLPGVEFSFAHPVVCTSIYHTNMVTTRALKGDLWVSLYDKDGNAQAGPTQDDFTCAVYDGS